ncbi:hypothetical protein BJ878DRAFT_480423 [Calycina marina]|uniref:DUF676 domain-containing protein n=1 Tax=Calycina marina TaxID=1763456 RepID=A0A9P7Z259_9HELO|nr:hypothetical protein BJ878DRAFT_480423 [Calycina marina]
MAAIKPFDIKRFEVTEIYAHPDAKVDIVLVHGLNGDPQNTWTASNGVFWPTDLLPVTLKSVKARILVYGYNADVVTFGSNKGSPSSDMIYQHAQSLVTNLAMERLSEETTEHPIIFVAHSLGGILVKRALELSNDLTSQHADENRNIFVSTYGIIFLGTPHTGADPAKWGLLLERLVHLMPKKFMVSGSQLVKTLQTNNETLQNINIHFLDILPKFRVCMAHEEMETDLKGTKTLIVDQTSAAPMLPDVVYFGIANTHSGMCKFESKNSPGYLNVSTTLKLWIQEAPKFIAPRQEFERKLRRQAKQAYADELLGVFPSPTTGQPWACQKSGLYSIQELAETFFSRLTTYSTSPAMSNPSSMKSSTVIPPKETASIELDSGDSVNEPHKLYFVKPSGFRSNAYFVGRHSEMTELSRMIFDSKRRSQGTSAVLLQSMPGAGKTHLARQFVFENKGKFPGGIFWLRARSKHELAAGYWDVARKIVLKHQNLASPKTGSEQDTDEFMKTVKKWLNKRHDWLLVLDGIRFDDLDGMQRFIPDSTQTAIIYTSTERSASGNHLWMSPQMIKLGVLGARDAQELLLQELDKKKPYARDDLRHSMNLVQSMGFLPVVIHLVAQRLKDTGEHLGKFAKSYASEPKLRGLGAYTAVVKQLNDLGAFEALNLAYILSFFSQHTPVEMIHLGLPALDGQHAPCLTTGNLNDTFKILNMFALIDRNVPEEGTSSQSSESIRSRDLLSDNIDVIRLHSVVQDFFVYTLHSDTDRSKYAQWLHRAVQVFCCSYDVAHERIMNKINTGLVEDYRLYEIHGIRLKEHVTRHKNSTTPETLTMLDLRLSLIKSEIEKRTEVVASSCIKHGNSEELQVSIFDRTSSSSDTAVDTPGYELRLQSAASTWGFEQHESPKSIKHSAAEYSTSALDLTKRTFPPIVREDPGYDSDREDSVLMTAQPSQWTPKLDQSSPDSDSAGWERARPRRIPRSRLDIHHRTTQFLEDTRYHDRAGAFRAIGGIDPRSIQPRPSRGTRIMIEETVEGYVDNTPNRSVSRGHNGISGKSSAEVALSTISKSSPPPARGGGAMLMARGRSSSQTTSEKSVVRRGRPSYASAVSGSTRENAPGHGDAYGSGRPDSSHDSVSSIGSPPTVSAIEALHRLPLGIVTQLSPPTTYQMQNVVPMPPYPVSPADERSQPFDRVSRYNQENLRPLSTSSLNYFPKMSGLPPFDTRTRSPSSPLRYDHSDEYRNISSVRELYNQGVLSLSSPDLFRGIGSTYVPGHPELSYENSGYTSQPMSRDSSNQGIAQTCELRRTSLVETEPMPNLADFSPKVQTSYQVYMKDEKARDDRPSLRQSPPMRFAEPLKETQLDNNTTERRRFNPMAPSFSPSISSAVTSPMPSSMPSSRYPSSLQSELSFQPPPATQRSSPRLIPRQSPCLVQGPFAPQSVPCAVKSVAAPEIDRSTSGGFLVGPNTVIEFGTGVPGVVVEEARQRAEQNRRRLQKKRIEQS